MESGTEEICANCKKTAKEAKLEKLKRCTQCKSVSFCGQNCQKKNYKYHRSLCEKIKEYEAKLQREESEYESMTEKEKESSSGTEKMDLINNLKFLLARKVVSFATDKKAYQRVIYYLKDLFSDDHSKKDVVVKQVLPWKSFMYMLIGEDEKSFEIIKDVMKENDISIEANKTVKDDLRTEFFLFYKKFQDKFKVQFNEQYAWILIALKYKVLHGLLSNESRWRKLYTKFEKAHEDSRSGEFFRSDHLMAGLESFIKGNPSKFEQRKKALEAEIQYYYLEMISPSLADTPESVKEFYENMQANNLDSFDEFQKYRNYFTAQLLHKYLSRQGAELKNYLETLEKEVLEKEKGEKLGKYIHEDISKFGAELKKRMPMESDDDFQEWQFEVQQTLKLSCEFVLAHPWPSSTSIVKFIRKNAKMRGVFEEMDIKGPEFYNHDLAKELWESNTILDYVERKKKYRTIGWKIKVHADSLITESENKVMKCMQTFYYLHQHVMCGPGIFPDKGKQNKPKELWGLAGMIERAWDEVGPWRK